MSDSFKDDLAQVAGIQAVPMILDVVCRTTGMGFAAVARVTEDRWIACAVDDRIGFGLKPGGELEVRTTICNEIRASGRAVTIDHVAEDDLFRDHHTPKMYGLQSYISVPIVTPAGGFFGTLCAIDIAPHKVSSPEIIGMFKLFADLIGFHLEAGQKLQASQMALANERETSLLREQFIAVLGHDLRNPLASIDAGARMLSRARLDDKQRGILSLMQKSVKRMSGLVDNLLDFARGRLGGGLGIDLREDPSLEEALRDVVAELGSVWPERAIVGDILIGETPKVDTNRLTQLFSNLLGNALSHGAHHLPVTIRVRSEQGMFSLAVANGGEPIPPEIQGKLFQPFSRSSKGGQEGLGLGLFIASEIARAHGGRLEAQSTAAETRFTFTMPLAGARTVLPESLAHRQNAARGDLYS